MENKTCKSCKETKNLLEFRNTGKYFSNECKVCLKNKRKEGVRKPKPKEGYKFCASCKDEKKLEEFYFRYSSTLKRKSHTSYCKLCEKIETAIGIFTNAKRAVRNTRVVGKIIQNV